MDYLGLKDAVKEGKKSPIYLLEGEDSYFLEHGLSLIKGFVKDDIDYAVFNGDDNGVLSSLESFSFTGGDRVTAIREFYPNEQTIEKFRAYLENPYSNSILVIVNQKPFSALEKFKNITIVDCKKADATILSRWIKAECGREGVEIDLETASLIVEFCLSDMTRIENETHKLIAFIGKGGTVKREDVINTVSKDAEYKIYEMTDYIAKKKRDAALEVINDMINKGDMTPQKIITSVYNYFRKLLFVAISDMSKEEMMTALNLKEYPLKKTIEQSKCFKKKALKEAVDILSDADYKIKCGKLSADTALNYCLFKIMSK